MFGWFNRKKELEQIKNEVRGSFSNVKQDMDKIAEWVSHFNNKHSSHEKEILSIKDDLSNIKLSLNELKSLLDYETNFENKQVFKTPQGVYNKQTAVYGVQTPVQTPVQTGKFGGFSNISATERAIISILVNSDLKLSYDDLAAMLGKTRSTIRGQINSIKQKSGGLINEYTEKNGKKRVYIDEDIKKKVLKNVKVRVKTKKNKEE